MNISHAKWIYYEKKANNEEDALICSVQSFFFFCQIKTYVPAKNYAKKTLLERSPNMATFYTFGSFLYITPLSSLIDSIPFWSTKEYAI